MQQIIRTVVRRVEIDDAHIERSAERGVRSMLQMLSRREIKVTVIAPIPEQHFDAPTCLARRTRDFCSVTRLMAEERRNIAAQAVQRAAACLLQFRGLLAQAYLPLEVEGLISA